MGGPRGVTIGLTDELDERESKGNMKAWLGCVSTEIGGLQKEQARVCRSRIM